MDRDRPTDMKGNKRMYTSSVQAHTPTKRIHIETEVHTKSI